MDIGDWTTYEGLAEENSYEPVVFGSKPAVRKPSPAKKDRTAVPKAKGGLAGVSMRGIDKKKKKGPRCAGLMKVADSPAEAVSSDLDVDEDVFEGPSVPSPYIVNSKNPFAALGDLMDAEEAEEAREAEEKAKVEADAAKKAQAIKWAPKAKKEESFVEAVAASPIVRRTRGAFKAFSTTFEKVVDFVKNSPALVERSRSVFADTTTSSTNVAPLAPAPAAKAAPAVKAAPAKAAPAPAAAPVRRSSRLRPTA